MYNRVSECVNSFKEMCTDRPFNCNDICTKLSISLSLSISVCAYSSAFHANCHSAQWNKFISDIRSMIRLLAILIIQQCLRPSMWPTICKNFFSMTHSHSDKASRSRATAWPFILQCKLSRNLCLMILVGKKKENQNGRNCACNWECALTKENARERERVSERGWTTKITIKLKWRRALRY